jgi:integrase
MAKAFTNKTIEAFKPHESRREIPDPALSGLYMLVQPSGAKSWALRYRYAGKTKKLTLGKWPILGLADARAAASDAIGLLEYGSDPSAAKKRAKANRIDAEITGRDTVKVIFDRYAERYLSKLKTGNQVKRSMEREFLPDFGDCDIGEVTKRDVIDIIEEIFHSGRETLSNRVRSYLSGFFNWCLARDLISVSPVQGVPKFATETARTRYLSDDEIRWFWLACERAGYPWKQAGQTLLLTGQRLGEVLGMNDGELYGNIWKLPADRTKNGRQHDVPLSQAVQDILNDIVRVDSPARLVFTTTGNTPVSGHFKARNRLARFMKEIATVERGEEVEIEHWNLHDLRRTAATNMARLSIPVRVTEAALNHVSGTGGGIVAVYQRHDYADEKRGAMDAWARFVADLVTDGPDSVLQSDL